MTTLQEIVEACLEEFNRFKSSGEGQSESCFQLFAMGVRKEDSAAFTAI